MSKILEHVSFYYSGLANQVQDLKGLNVHEIKCVLLQKKVISPLRLKLPSMFFNQIEKLMLFSYLN